jgi:hypothetical protein
VFSKADKNTCPVCNTAVVSGVCLLPLSFQDVERAIELKTDEADAKGTKSEGSKRGFHFDLQDEIAYGVLSQGRRHRTADCAGAYQRTGRWTDEETAFVDHLVWAFDEGIIPIPNGMKLNQCLSDFLLCKLSRLTKKMKNAKLSSRTFVRRPRTQSQTDKYKKLFSLQRSFLQSVGSESLRVELRFNLTRQWRIQFSNMCLQVGYPLRKEKFMASLDELEHRASRLEGVIKKKRRLDMGAALGLQIENSSLTQHDQVSSTSSLLQDSRKNIEGPGVASRCHRSASLPDLAHYTQRASILQHNPISWSSSALDELGKYAQGLDTSQPTSVPDHQLSQSGLLGLDRSCSDDFDSAFMTLMQPHPTKAREVSLNTQSSGDKAQSSTEIHQHQVEEERPRDFMEAIAMYMEANNLPFVHADAWVPSHVASEGDGQEIRLLHAGCATRRDTSDEAFSILDTFGEYSKTFSFEISSGLPGRVYSSGVDRWESHVDEVQQSVFARSSGANSFGLKTAVGFPLGTSGVGRMVIVMYSFDEVQKDSSLITSFASALEKYSPEPKWKLVIDIGKDAPPIRKSGEYGIMPKMTGAETISNAPKASTYLPSQIGRPLASALSSASMSPRHTSELSNIFPDIAMDFPANSMLRADPASASASGRLTPLSLRQPSTRADAIEQNIISLLGDQIPLSATTGPKDAVSYSSADISNFIPHCMAIRLMLLRTPDSRSESENQIIEVLKSSYKAFTNDNRRSGPELAMLLVRDWICLSGSMVSANATSGRRPPAQTLPRTSVPLARAPAVRNPAALNGPPPMKPLLPPGSRLSRPPAPQMLPFQPPRRVSVPGELQPLEHSSTHGRLLSTGELPPLARAVAPKAPLARQQSTGGLPGNASIPSRRQSSVGKMCQQPLPSAPPLSQYPK